MSRRANVPRQGAILVCVLVCVGIASTIMLTSLGASLRARRQMRREMQMEQTRWLVEAAMIRGSKAVQDMDDYQGETWNAGEALAAYSSAEVTIGVTTDGMPAGAFKLDVSAEIHGTGPISNSTRRSDSFIVVRSDQTED